MIDAVIVTPIGHLGLGFQVSKLISVRFLASHVLPFPSTATLSTKVKKTIQRMEDFFISPQALTDLPHEFRGTPFQSKVWNALRKIPLGEATTYGELAMILKTSARAIGMACRTNPLPIVIPCHRVVATGSLGGFCGTTSGGPLTIKQWLLTHERVELSK